MTPHVTISRPLCSVMVELLHCNTKFPGSIPGRHNDFHIFLLRERSSEVFLFFLQKSGILLKSSDFCSFDHFSSQNWWFTSQIWYDDFLSRKFIQFLDFFRIFPEFLQISVDWMIFYLSNVIWWFSFPVIYPVSGFFPGFFRIFFKSLDFAFLNHISSNNWYFVD